MTFVSAVNAIVRNFLLSARVLPPATIGVASFAPPSSVVVRPGVAGFITGDRVHGLRCFRLLGLMLVSDGRDYVPCSHSFLRFFDASLC